MAEENVGIFTALIRWLTFYNWRAGRKINRSADRQFTETPDGIADGFDIHNDKLVGRYRAIRSAITTFETALETKRVRANDLGAAIEKKDKALTGVLAAIEKAIAAKDAAKEAECRADYKTFKQESTELHSQLDTIEADLKEAETRRGALVKQMQDLKKEIDNLPGDKAAAIAEFVSNTQLKETLDQISGLQTTADRGPIDAIRERNKQLAAEVRVAQRMNVAETTDREKQYTEEGVASSADDEIEAALKKRAADRAEKTGEAVAPTADRPQV